MVRGTWYEWHLGGYFSFASDGGGLGGYLVRRVVTAKEDIIQAWRPLSGFMPATRTRALEETVPRPSFVGCEHVLVTGD